MPGKEHACIKAGRTALIRLALLTKECPGVDSLREMMQPTNYYTLEDTVKQISAGDTDGIKAGLNNELAAVLSKASKLLEGHLLASSRKSEANIVTDFRKVLSSNYSNLCTKAIIYSLKRGKKKQGCQKICLMRLTSKNSLVTPSRR